MAALEALAAQAAGTRLEVLRLDVTDAASIADCQAEIGRRTDGKGIDALVNNAGYGAVGPLEEMDDAALKAQFDTNVFGLLAVTRAFIPEMRAKGHGRIINVSSIGGRISFPMMGAYTATKHAVEALSDALRMELAPFGIAVSIVEPGAIRTEFNEVAVSSLVVRPGSPYAAALRNAAAVTARFDAMGVGPEHVATAVEHAVVSRRPQARYVRPWRSYGMLFFKWLLPTTVFDRILAGQMGLAGT
jgi:NAD(P)-dependent dehydrogenase (short-subunit alcohol dehydrogenase family)